MKEKVNQLFKDKLILVMLVLGLLTIVAAAGAVTIRKNGGSSEKSPYLEIQESQGLMAGQETTPAAGSPEAGNMTEAADAADMEGLPEEINVSGEPVGNQLEKQTAGQAAEEAGAVANESLVLNFTEGDRLLWPVSGNVILGYSMETTTWFPTLEQYKCNPANLIQGEVSTPVAAPADARVLEIGTNEEIGAYLKLDLGNGYTAICGQLKEIPVVENEYLHRGDVIGYIAEPTKYYSVEGSNLYFELLHDDMPVDSLDYLE